MGPETGAGGAWVGYEYSASVLLIGSSYQNGVPAQSYCLISELIGWGNAALVRRLGAFYHHPHGDPQKYNQRNEEEQTVKDIAKVTPFFSRFCFHFIFFLATSYLHPTTFYRRYYYH